MYAPRGFQDWALKEQGAIRTADLDNESTVSFRELEFVAVEKLGDVLKEACKSQRQEIVGGSIA